MEQRSTRRESGPIVFGLILLVVGVYYLLERTLGFSIPELDWNRLWPLILIVIGGSVVYSAWSRHESS